jgi:hypothetical protein
MKHLLLTIIAAVLVVGCGESQQSAPAPETKPVEPVAEAAKPTTPPKAVTANKGADPARGIKPEPPTAKAPDISIHEASEEGNIETIKQHLAAGTDVNAKESFFQSTPLHRACLFGRKEVVKMLLANGADVNAKDDDMMTALSYATTGEDKEIVELLLDKGANLTDEVGPPLLGVSNKGIVKLLIAEGVDVNAKADQGETPLYHAGTGETALHGAASEGYKEAAGLLITAGADVNAKDNNGKTPLDFAESVFPANPLQVKAAKKEIADLLHKHGGKTGEELKAEGK